MARGFYTDICLVASALRFEIDGNEGTNIEYLQLDTQVETADRAGIPVRDGRGPLSLRDDFTVPGFYEVTFKPGAGIKNQGGKNKGVMEPYTMKLLRELEIEEIISELDLEVAAS